MSETVKAFVGYRAGMKYQQTGDRATQTPWKGVPSFKRRFSRFDGDTGVLYIFDGFAWNGASGPTIDSDSSIWPSGEHDDFYGAIADGWGADQQASLAAQAWQRWVLRRKVDVFFARRLVECGMSKWRAQAWLWGVRKFGASHAEPEGRDELLTAPLGESSIDLAKHKPGLPPFYAAAKPAV